MPPGVAVDIPTLTVNLGDSITPNVCVSCLAAIIPKAGVDKSQYMLELQRNDHSFLTAALSYIIATGNARRADMVASDRHDALKFWVRRCMNSTEDCDWRRRHQVTLDVLEIQKDFDVEFLCLILDYFLSVVRRDSAQRFSRHLWPACAEDVLPAGPKDTTTALCFWLRMDDSSHVVSFVRSVYKICEQELRHHRPALIEATLAAVDCTISDINLNNGPPRPRGELDELLQRDPAQRLHALTLLLVRVGMPVHHSSLDPILVEHMKTTINRALDVATMEGTIDKLSSFGAVLLIAHKTPMEVHPRIKEIQRRAQYDSYRNLHEVLVDTIERRVCSWPACSLSEQDIGRPLSLCGRCRVYRYCSSWCQKLHWKVSHRSSCDGLRVLFNATSIQFSANLPEGDFAAACQAANFSDDDAVAISRAYGLMAMEDPVRGKVGTPEIWGSVWLDDHRAKKARQAEMPEVIPQSLTETAPKQLALVTLQDDI